MNYRYVARILMRTRLLEISALDKPGVGAGVDESTAAVTDRTTRMADHITMATKTGTDSMKNSSDNTLVVVDGVCPANMPPELRSARR